MEGVVNGFPNGYGTLKTGNEGWTSKFLIRAPNRAEASVKAMRAQTMRLVRSKRGRNSARLLGFY
jgi:hypothetical protein